MKVGILTQPLELNYGGILQAFALQETLLKLGCSVKIIDQHRGKQFLSFRKHLLNFFKRIYLRVLKKKDVSISWDPSITPNDYAVISSELQKFKDDKLFCTRFVYENDLKQIDEEYLFDAYVVGSDQVWFWNWCPHSFLDFVERDVVRLFYAASTGNKSFYDDERIKRQCIHLSTLFNGISVRERYLVNKVQTVLHREAWFVLDPTMLLDGDDYIKSIEFESYEGDFLLYYILDMSPEKKKIINECADSLSLPLKNAGPENYYVKRKNVDLSKCMYPSLDSWISKFKQSSFVVTDSFHGAVFSIIFKKNFIVIGNKSRGMERFNSLLELFRLEKRLYNPDTFASVVKENIDYSVLLPILDKMKIASLEFLYKYLKQ